MMMKLSFYLIPVLLPGLAMVPTVSSQDVRAGSSSVTLKKLNLEGAYVAKVGGKSKKLTLSASGRCNFLGTSGQWRVRNQKGKVVSSPGELVSKGEVDVYLSGIRLRCYFRINSNGSLSAYAVTGVGGEQRTVYKKPVVYSKR